MPKAQKVVSNTAALQLEECKSAWKTEAEELVMQTFPKLVLELDALASSPQFDTSRLPEVRVDLNVPIPDPLLPKDIDVHEDLPAAKKRKLDAGDSNCEGTKVIAFVNGLVPSNKLVMELIDIVKPLVRKAVENVNKVKMWILFLIPRIEDGNNFGVSIQEDTLAEVRTVEAEAASFLDQISRYLITRGKLVSRVAKYPHVEDYRNAIGDVDEKEFLNLRLVLMELRNHYSTLHDMIIKNFEKIKKPRSSSAEHLY